MRLSMVPFDQLHVGDRVISAINTPGVVTAVFKDPRYQPDDQDGWTVWCIWDNGRMSTIPHYGGERITYVGFIE